MKKAELVFIPSLGMGHLVSMVEIAKLIINRDNRVSITVLIMNLFDSQVSAYSQSLQSTLTGSIRFMELPQLAPPTTTGSRAHFLSSFIDSQIPLVQNAVTDLFGSDTRRLAGFVIDMFCTCMIDVANQFRVPSYMFFTSGAAFLDLMLHVRSLTDDYNQVLSELKDSDTEFTVPSLVNPVPAKVLPQVFFDKDGWADYLLQHARRFGETKGIMVNTFVELESRAVDCLSNGRAPPIYPVGPIINFQCKDNPDLMTWLDKQPEASVVFLCFGSMGTFEPVQVREIANALERSGIRFLWSLRTPPPEGKMSLPTDCTNLEELLPDGFLDRTAEIGRVIGWAPQVAVLAHKAVGGFVSHCGWNSTLESLWCSVPVATWPVYAEQQLNAFVIVKESKMAVEIRLAYDQEGGDVVKAEEIERGIRCLMEHDSEVRKKVKTVGEISRKTLLEGGSSYASLGRFIDDVLAKMS